MEWVKPLRCKDCDKDITWAEHSRLDGRCHKCYDKQMARESLRRVFGKGKK